MSLFVLMAGGTGGHLFPAMALAQELRRRGHTIHLMTDHRVTSYGADFPAREVHVVPSATPSISNPVKFVAACFKILWGTGVAWGKLGQVRPDAVIGFGGYPVFPPFLAASLSGIPGILHEQNAVMGRANRALARFARVVALSFAETRYADATKTEKVVTGNPVRDAVRAVSGTPYPGLKETDAIHLLVFGGSQGARVMADLVPPAIAALPEGMRTRIAITQQCRAEDMDRVRAAYDGLGVRADLQPFFADMPARIAATHLVVSRSGASTVAELAVIGRPAIMIPLPGALDQDQKANAEVMARAGGGWMVEQRDMSPARLASDLADLLDHPDSLAAAAEAALRVGRPDAAEKLADVAEAVAQRKPFKEAAAA